MPTRTKRGRANVPVPGSIFEPEACASEMDDMISVVGPNQYTRVKSSQVESR